MRAPPAASTSVLGPAALYKHEHPPIRNAHEVYAEKLSMGQRVAEKVTAIIGGWPFIITQTLILLLWIALNIYLVYHWKDKVFDPYPFILLNLVLSFQAAYTGPIVMMSQNRQNQKDRFAAQGDFECNVKAEEEIRVIMDHLVHQDTVLAQQDQILAHQDKLLADITARLENLQAQQAQAPRTLSIS
jgi:uncharacterized membrane protein